jgi:tRNA A-37 threonylcarbamoyl transferase component Bud32
MQNLGRPIAVGSNSEVFSWGDHQALKLGYPWAPVDWIEAEFSVGRDIQGMGLPIPKVYERVRVNDREGIIFEKVEGPTLFEELADRPWNIKRYAQMLAELHCRIHAVTAPAHFESQQELARAIIFDENKFLPLELHPRVMALLDALSGAGPEGSALCHGDFHTGNIIMTRQGPMIIDWILATRGSAIGDVARTSILLKAGRAPVPLPDRRLLDAIRNVFCPTYLEAYFQIRPEGQEQLRRWEAIMAASHLEFSIPEERAGLLDIIYTGLVNE